jgi:hypothetical protein
MLEADVPARRRYVVALVMGAGCGCGSMFLVRFAGLAVQQHVSAVLQLDVAAI